MKKGSVVKKKRIAAEEPLMIEAKRELRRLQMRPLKGLGQHFLIDNTILETIVSAAELSPADTVLEIGPGLGILTRRLLAEAGRVIAVEVDPRLASALVSKFPRNTHLRVVNDDILRIEPRKLVAGDEASVESSLHYKVVANLPYHIASPVLRHFLEASSKPCLMVVMVQKEVGMSIAAGPGEMSILGISVQVYGKPAIVEYVPARSFYPQPKVESAIVRIDVYPSPIVDVADISGFFAVVKGGFSTPRKQLRNSLRTGLELEASEVDEILRESGVDAKRRPQTLSLEEWADVYRVFSRRGGL